MIAGFWLITLIVVWASWRKRAPDQLCPTSLLIVFFTGLTAFQAVPLPCEFVARIAPQSVSELRAALSSLATNTPHWCSISRDPGNTELELIKGVAFLSAFLASWILVVIGKRVFVLRCVAASVTLLALVSICHQLASAEAVFGVYTPVFAARPVFGPLMNPNNLAGFLIMGFPSLVVLGVKSSRENRLIWFAFSALVGGALFLSLSRGGIAAFLGTAVFITVMVFVHRKGSKHRYGLALFTGGTAAFGIALGAYVAFQVFWAEMLQGDLSKFDLIGEYIPLLHDVPLIGIGRGAFSAVAPQYRGTTTRPIYSENIFVDWAFEWGLPATTVLILVIGVVIVRRLKDGRSLTRHAAIVGVLGISAQNLVDFGLELAGIGSIASALLAVAVAPLGDNRSPRAVPLTGWLTVRRLSLYSIVAGLVALTVFVPRVLASNITSVRAEMERHFLRGDRRQFRIALTRALVAHPSEPEFPWFAANEAFRYRDLATLRWLNRTMKLAPHWPGPHELAARWLFSHGRRAQGFVELREAEVRARGSSRGLMCLVLGLEKSTSNLLSAAPLDPQAKVRFLEDAGSCLDFHTTMGRSIDSVLLALDQKLTMPRIRKALLLIEEGKTAAAIEILTKVAEESPLETDLQITLADALLRTGSPKEAIEVLRKAEKRVADKWRLVELRARAETDLGNVSGMRKATDELLVLVGNDAGLTARVLALRGQLEERLGNIGHALRAFEESNRIRSERASLVAILSLAGRMGDRMRTFSALSQLCTQYEDDAYCKARDNMLKPAIGE